MAEIHLIRQEEPDGTDPDEEIVSCPNCGNILLMIYFSGMVQCCVCDTAIEVEWSD